jgi:hypothetical protein
MSERDKQDKPVDPKQSLEYWVALCQKLFKENEELREKLRSFRGY